MNMMIEEMYEGRHKHTVTSIVTKISTGKQKKQEEEKLLLFVVKETFI